LDNPAATSATTSRSRSVRAASPARVGPPGRVGATGAVAAAGGEQRVAAGDDADGLQQFGRLHVLDQETAGSAAQRREHRFLVVECGQHDDLGGAEVRIAGDHAGGRDPVDLRHVQVHQDHVGSVLAR
jgi:hypothetical protein